MTRLPGELGTYLGITGLHIRAADALFTGLADWCLPNDRGDEFDQRLGELEWNAPALECLKTLLVSMASPKLLGAELKAMAAAIDVHFAFNTVQDICASLRAEDRYAFQDWAEQTVALINNRSPLALSVTLELFRRGRELSLSDCFRMERHLGRQWFEKGDLIEGVRALIVDKDKRPQWNPINLAEITPQRIAVFFEDFDHASPTDTGPTRNKDRLCTTSN